MTNETLEAMKASVATAEAHLEAKAVYERIKAKLDDGIDPRRFSIQLGLDDAIGSPFGNYSDEDMALLVSMVEPVLDSFCRRMIDKYREAFKYLEP